MASRIDLLDRALAERSLADFVRQAWPVLEPKTPYLENWHHELLVETLEAVAAGEIARAIINVPPRFGKSLLASIFFPVWVWLRDPRERFLFASYSAPLANKHSVDRRALIQSPWFQARWGSIVKLADDGNQKTEFTNTARGHMIATSVGASATGRGGNFLVCDDLINPHQAASDAERSSAIRWFDETFSTRLDDKRFGRQIVIEQRTHSQDLTGHLLAEAGWHHIALPAIAERRTIVTFPRSGREVVREEGDILWPAREGAVELEAAKQRLGSFGFQSQYQQSPTAREGNTIKADWLTATYRAIPRRFDSLVMSIDTAFKTGAANDYSAAVVIGTLRAPREGSPPGHYLLDAWRGKVEFVDLKRKVVELHATWRPNSILIEDAASGQSLIQELRVGATLPIKPIRPDRDKNARVAAVTPDLEARRLLLPEVAWWRDEFIAELTSFPAGAHDDWCDALAMALNHLRDGGEKNLIKYYKLETAARWVNEGLGVDEAARRAGLSSAELLHWMDRKLRHNPWKPAPASADDDDPGTRYDKLTERLLVGYRPGGAHHVTIDPEMYKHYVRPRLCRSSDPKAAALMSELNQRFGLSPATPIPVAPAPVAPPAATNGTPAPTRDGRSWNPWVGTLWKK